MAVAALPVALPADPLTLPVTFPTTLPVYPSEVIVPSELPLSANVIVPPFASRVMPPSESNVTVVPASSAVPSAVICMLPAAPPPSVVAMSSVPFVPAVIVAVSPLEPVIVITLPFTATSSTVRADKVPTLVIFVWAAVLKVPASSPEEPYITALLLTTLLAVEPSSKFNSVAVDVTLVPPISNVVTDISPATVTRPLATVIRSVSSVWPIVVPFIITLSTVSVLNVPTDVRLGIAVISSSK